MAGKFRYHIAFEEIKRRIETGLYQEKSQIPHTKDLARELNFSPITIDKALNHLVERGYINRTPKKGSFVNSSNLWKTRREAKNVSGMIGAILFTTRLHDFWAESLNGIESALNKNGFHLVLGNDEGNLQKANQYLKDLHRKGIDGFIIVPLGMSSEQEYERENARLIDYIEGIGIPYILFNRYLKSRNCSYVTIEHYSDTMALMEEFLKAGVKNPICITGYYAITSAFREQAFCDALAKHGFKDAEKRIYRFMPQEQSIGSRDRDAIRRILHAQKNADGILPINAELLRECLTIQEEDPDLRHLDTRYVGHLVFQEQVRSSRLHAAAIMPVHELGEIAGEILVSRIKRRQRMVFRVSAPSRILLLRSH